MAATTNGKRKILSIKDKVRVIRACESGRKTADVCREFGLVNSTVGSILKNKEKILKAFKEDGENLKKIRKCSHGDVDSALLKWVQQCRSSNIKVSRPILREKANEFGRLFGVDFTCSNGWIDRFKARHSISFSKNLVVPKSVDLSIKDDWLENTWPSIRSQYKDEDIFNGDETGFFYKLTPGQTQQYKNEKCIDGKHAEHRVTVFVCANMTGTEKRRLLVIGTVLEPDSFINVRTLPVTYTANDNAWMTAAIFEEELITWDKELSVQKRKILLLLDDCPVHPEVNLSNINLVFFPANCASALQPMEQGIVRSLKCHYRKELLKRFLGCMYSQEPTEISMLDAVQYLDNAWRDVSQSTISKCFRIARLSKGDTCDVFDKDEFSLSEWSKIFNVYDNILGGDLDSYALVDEQLATCQALNDVEIVQGLQSTEPEECSKEVGPLKVKEEVKRPTVEEAFKAAETLSNFFYFQMPRATATTFGAVRHLQRVTQGIYFTEKGIFKKISGNSIPQASDVSSVKQPFPSAEPQEAESTILVADVDLGIIKVEVLHDDDAHDTKDEPIDDTPLHSKITQHLPSTAPEDMEATDNGTFTESVTDVDLGLVKVEEFPDDAYHEREHGKSPNGGNMSASVGIKNRALT